MSSNPLEEGLGPFFIGVPAVLAVACLVTVVYLIFVHRHVPMAASIAVWFGIVMATASQWALVGGLQWDLANDWPGVVVSNLMFGVPIIVFYLAYTRSPSFSDFMLGELPAADLIAWQFCRIAGAAYLYIYFNRTVYNLIALQVGVFDVTIALTSIPLSCYVRSVGLKDARRLVQAWNVFGVLDLAIPFMLFPFNLFGVLYTPNESLSFFMIYPITAVFLYNVPLAMTNHLFFLLQYDAMTSKSEAGEREADLTDPSSVEI